MGKKWDCETVQHNGFKDLGNYVIELPDFTDPASGEKGLASLNDFADHGKLSTFGCTAMAKRNSKGEVILGRNMDLDISQSPAYVFKTTYGKYSNFNVSYIPDFYLTYEEVKKLDEIDPIVRDMMQFLVCDSINEKGLYIEGNMRERNDKLTCYGLHSSRGEKNRDDGTPWSELRATTTAVIPLVSQNCATVQEAICFLENSYDWYSAAPESNSDFVLNNANICFMIGDATGEYGLIEIAQDEVSYIPYQFGQANYFITPKWNALDSFAVGHGRLAMVSKVIGPVDTLEEAMDAMKPIMWRNETLWIGESHRFTDGSHLHRYNQIAFEDDEGTPQMDWRGDYIFYWPVLDDGRMLIDAAMYEEAKRSTYDPKIKEYFDDAVAAGQLVIDDGSIKFSVNDEQLTLTELSSKYNEYKVITDLEKRKVLQPYHDEYYRLLTNENRSWAHDDDNFEAIKAVAYARLHVRYDMEGKFDPSCMSKYEKLLAFYGYGVDKDEAPLRDDGQIWTTSVNVGVNCAQKEMKIRFWENDDIIYHVKL
ncbi:MAG: linear amide C-N hydrolase [Anaerovibrio sp.]|uniref:linear amide C-N hydrolase n=1 Tax=Anaerovibrio sp. TaxID=1872532 RepID=UPI0025E78A65|nr:linear amide C-N hydrolase [Anaerovibrio sp.]MCR5175537.1 linear amide C-N hydrolase [Anaerovibrio sp.]